MMRSYKFRLYPTKTQARELSEMLGTFCWLYNQMLEERRDGWRNYGHNFTYFQQSAGLKYLRRRDERLARYSSRAELFVVKRADLAFQAFFRRLKSGDAPGYPRFKPSARFDAARFDVGDGLSVRGSRARFKGVDADIRIKRHREVVTEPKCATLKREGRRWFLILHAEIEAEEVTSRPYSPVGLDAGLTSIVALTTGETVPTPQFTARASKRIRRHSRALARAVKGSKRRQKARERLASAHRKAARQRADFLHKLSRRIVDSHSHIAIEDLNVAGMARSLLAKSIHNAAWSTLRNFLSYKVEETGGTLIAVNPRGTSQACSGCGAVVQKALSVRSHKCPHCGLAIDRDLNAARNILARANFRPGTGHRDASQPVAA